MEFVESSSTVSRSFVYLLKGTKKMILIISFMCDIPRDFSMTCEREPDCLLARVWIRFRLSWLATNNKLRIFYDQVEDKIPATHQPDLIANFSPFNCHHFVIGDYLDHIIIIFIISVIGRVGWVCNISLIFIHLKY
jgi:hypothetical protein